MPAPLEEERSHGAAEAPRKLARVAHGDDLVAHGVRHERGARDLAEPPAHARDAGDELRHGAERDRVVAARTRVQVDHVARGGWPRPDHAPDVRREIGEPVADRERGREEQQRRRLSPERQVERHGRARGESADDDLAVAGGEVVVRGERA